MFTLAAFAFPLPYVIESPGVTENTLGSFHGKDVIAITGHRTYPTDGIQPHDGVREQFDYQPKLAEVFKAWVDPHEAVLPRLGLSAEPAVKQSERVDTGRCSDAVRRDRGRAPAGGLPGVRADGRKGDQGRSRDHQARLSDGILAVGGRRTTNAQAVINAISPLRPGTRTTLTIRARLPRADGHAGDRGQPAVTDQVRGRGGDIGDSFNPPFKVAIKLGQQIGGPSAGLMFWLAIYDKLTPGALTELLRLIAGTGTIDQRGRVGPIGGIQQKITGARNFAAGRRSSWCLRRTARKPCTPRTPIRSSSSRSRR